MRTLCLSFAETCSAAVKPPICLCTYVPARIATPFSIQGRKKKKEKWRGKYVPQTSKARYREVDHSFISSRPEWFQSNVKTKQRSVLGCGKSPREGRCGRLGQGAFCTSLRCSLPVGKCRWLNEAGLCERSRAENRKSLGESWEKVWATGSTGWLKEWTTF